MFTDHESNEEAYSRVNNQHTFASLPPFYGSLYNSNSPTFHRAHKSLTAVPETDALGLDFCAVVQSPSPRTPFPNSS